MLKKITMLTVGLAIGAILFFVDPVDAAKGFKHLSFMGGYMERHPTVVNVFKPFMKAAEEKFNGKLSFDYFATNALYPEAEAFGAVSDGRVDLGQIRPLVFPGKMNLIGVIALPGMCPNAIVGSLVAEELAQKFKEVRDEFPLDSVHYFAWASASYQLHTIKPVRNAAELRGKKIIVWDAPTLEYMKKLGANPIRMSSPDTYLALSKSMADGVLCPLAPLRSYKITEATKYHMILNLGVSPFIEEFNKSLWDSMPEDMQSWLKEEGGLKMSLACGKSLEDGAKADTKWMEDQGHQFFYLSETERDELLSPLQYFADVWKSTDCKNIDPKLVDEVLRFARERSKYHTEQMRAGKYGNYKM